MEKNYKTNLLIVAFRNLNRHKVKTIITVTAVTIGVALYIILDAWILGMNIDSQRNIVNYEIGSTKIYSKAYFEKKDEKPMYESFGGWESVAKKLDENGFNTSPHSVFGGSLISQTGEYPFTFVGIDPELENKMFKYHEFIEKEGRFIEKGKFEMIIGSLGARNLKVKAGDTVKLSTVIDKKDETGKIKHINQLIDLKIAGIINSPNPKNNGNIGYIPLDILQDEAGLLLEGQITELCIRKKGVSETELPGKKESKDAVVKILGESLSSDLIVINWQDDVKDYFAASNGDKISTKIMTILLFILAFIGIANTMLMAVLERTKEIGMLRALGMTDNMILRLMIYEAGLIGFIGSMIGIVIGILVNIYMVNYGIDYSKMLEEYGTDYGYRVVGLFKSSWNYTTIIFSGVLGTLISSVTALMPTLRALSGSIVDALRFE
jgi:ABC-type lipoprotein release transport system permease subunit